MTCHFLRVEFGSELGVQCVYGTNGANISFEMLYSVSCFYFARPLGKKNHL